MSGPVKLLDPSVVKLRDDRWREARQRGIGASEIAAVLGISPWESPFSLYWRKSYGWADEDTADQRRGRRLESVVAEEWADEHPDWAVWPAGLYRHPDRQWQLCSPDRLLISRAPTGPRGALDPHTDVDELLECKTHVGSRDEWGEEGTDDIPVHYAAQVLWQLDVMGLQRCRVAVMFLPGWTLREYIVEYNPTDVAVMVKAGEEFVRRINMGEPPEPDWSAATTRALKRLHPTVEDRDVEIEAKLATDYDEAWRSVVQAKRHLKYLENEVREAIGDGHYATCQGRRVATRSVYDMHSVDVKRLRAEQPELAAEYLKTSTVNKIVHVDWKD